MIVHGLCMSAQLTTSTYDTNTGTCILPVMYSTVVPVIFTFALSRNTPSFSTHSTSNAPPLSDSCLLAQNLTLLVQPLAPKRSQRRVRTPRHWILIDTDVRAEEARHEGVIALVTKDLRARSRLPPA